jgi:hypothetical protein
MKTSDYMTCEAFARAIPHINRAALPADLRTQIATLLNELQASRLSQSITTEAIATTIRTLVEQDQILERLYQIERQKLQQIYRSSDRAKNITLAPASSFDLNRLTQLAIAATQSLTQNNTEASHTEAVNLPITRTRTKANTQLTAAHLDILRTLGKQPCTTHDLISIMSITTPPDQVQSIVQSLWRQGYIDTLNSTLLAKLFPTPKHSSQPAQPNAPEPDRSLTLTTKGHFSIHPIFRFGSQKAAF